MSIARVVQNNINDIPVGQIFGYQDLSDYVRSSSAVIKAVGRLVADKKLQRFSKGKFYRSKEGVLGARKPTDGELIRSVLYKDGRLRGYITGAALYNQLGLTTQIPKVITIAFNGGRDNKDFGTIRIKTQVSRIPINEKDVKLLQYLDVLKNIKTIPDSDINLSLKIMRRYISELSEKERSRFISLAEEYYTPQARALTGLLFADLKLPVPTSLKLSLNPTTKYKLRLDENEWIDTKEWNISK